MRRSSSVCCRSASRVLLLSVMSRATFDMPMVAPEGDLIGEMLSETSIGLPSLRKRVRFVVLDALAPADPPQRILHLGLPLRSGTRMRDALARGLGCGVAVQTFGGGIPAGDGAVERQRDDGVVGRFDRRAEQALALGMMVARRDRAAMLGNLAFERDRLCVHLRRSPARMHARARRSRRRHRPEWRPCRCGRALNRFGQLDDRPGQRSRDQQRQRGRAQHRDQADGNRAVSGFPPPAP